MTAKPFQIISWVVNSAIFMEDNPCPDLEQLRKLAGVSISPDDFTSRLRYVMEEEIKNSRLNTEAVSKVAGRCPLWMKYALFSFLDKLTISDATQFCSICGMEPRQYFSFREIDMLMRGLEGVACYKDTSQHQPAKDTVIKLAESIGKHLGLFGNTQHSWKEVVSWANSENYIPLLRAVCTRFGASIVKDLSSPYRRTYCEVLDGMPVDIPERARKEMAVAAAVRAFLADLYYALPAR